MLQTQVIWVWSLDWEDLLEKAMTTHSSILAWEIPWTEEPGGLQSVGSQSRAWLRTHTQLYRNEKTHEKEPLVLNLLLKQRKQAKWKTEANNRFIISKLSEDSFIRELSQPISQHVQQKGRPSEPQTGLKRSKSCMWGTYKDTGKLLICMAWCVLKRKGKEKLTNKAWLFGQCILAQLTWNQERSGKGQDSGSKWVPFTKKWMQEVGRSAFFSFPQEPYNIPPV